jgi:GTPase-associated system helical domain
MKDKKILFLCENMNNNQEKSMNQTSDIDTLPIIDRFLRDGLLQTLGEDEKRYQYLGDTVIALSNRIKENHRLLINFSILAFQPKPSVSEPEITMVYKTLGEHWKLIGNIYPKDKPIELLKAIMLETVNGLCNDYIFASIVYHANASAVSHYKYGISEGSLVKQVLQRAAEKTEWFAVEQYTCSNKVVEISEFNVNLSCPENIEVDQVILQDGLLAAAGPADEQGNTSKKKTPNPYTMANAGHWVGAFSKIATESIAESIESSIEEALSHLADDASEKISEKLQEVAGYRNNLKSVSLPIETKVLWWMQSLYSPNFRASYRDLPLPVTLIAMVDDLLDIISIPTVESLIYILGETILNTLSTFPAKERKAFKLSEWLEKFENPEILSMMVSHEINCLKQNYNSLSLIAVVQIILNGETKNEERIGDLLNISLTPRQFGMWLFRDLLAEKLVFKQDHE